MNKEIQNLDFIKRWNSIDFKIPRKEIIPKYEECPVLLNNKEAFAFIGIGDKIESPIRSIYFIVLEVKGNDLITISKNGKKGVRHFSELLSNDPNYRNGFYKLYKLNK